MSVAGDGLAASEPANDVDADGDALAIVAASHASHCAVSLNGDGSVHFVPEANYSGTASFDYTIADGNGGFDSATATINIAPVNDAPLVTNERASFNEDTVAHFAEPAKEFVASAGETRRERTKGETYLVGRRCLEAREQRRVAKRSRITRGLAAAALSANDTDIETPNSLTLTAVGGAQGGSVGRAGDDIVFTPWADFNGRRRFSTCLSIYTIRHIALCRGSHYNSTFAAKTRHQAGSGHPMAV